MRSARLFAQGLAEHKAGKLRSAQRLYRRCLAQDADHPDVLGHFGILHYQLQDYAAAIALLERGLTVAPGDPGMALNLGNCYQASGRLADAEACFRRALAAAPGFVEADLNLGNVLCARGRHDEGVACYRRAIAARPDYPQARRRLALALTAEGAASLEPPLLLEAEELLAGLMLSGGGDGEIDKAWKRIRWHLSRLRRDASAARLAFAAFEAVADEAELRLARNEMARIELECGDPRRATALCALAVPVPPGWRMEAAARVVGGWSAQRPLDVAVERDCLLLPGGRDWLVQARDGGMRFDGIVNANPEAGQYVRLVVPSGGVLLARPEAETTLDGPHLLLGGLPNYYHWMIDYLPRLRLAAADPALAALPMVVNADLAGFQRETLAALGVDSARLLPMAGPGAVRCRELAVADLGANFQQPHPDTIAWLRRTFGSAGPAAAPTRIWVSRRDAALRRVVNEDAVTAALARRGFTVVVAGTLGLAGQIAAFAGAEAVAGPHGAAFTNIVFSPPGARVLEIMPGRYGQLGFFPPLAEACGHHHRRLVADAAGSDPQNADMTVDIARLMAELDALGL